MGRQADHLNKVGLCAEEPDPTPVELVGSRPLTLREQIQLYIREEFSAARQAEGDPSFEEEDDFGEEWDEELGESRFQDMRWDDPVTLDGSESAPVLPPASAESQEQSKGDGAPGAESAVGSKD